MNKESIHSKTINKSNRLVSILIIVLTTFTIAILKADKKPNVLVFLVDDLRPELGCYGQEHIISPTIDSIAESGTLFTNAYCQVPVCGASRASLMTGIYPAGERFERYFSRADEDALGIKDIPALLKSNGYITASVGKVYHNAEDNKGSWDYLIKKKDFRVYLNENNLKLPLSERPPYEAEDVDDNQYTGGVIAEDTIKMLHEFSTTDQPFFMVSGFTKPHLPFNAPKKYWDLYDRDEISLPDNYKRPQGVPNAAMQNWEELRRMYGGVPDQGPVDHEMAIDLIHGYYACVSYTDAMIARVLQAMEELDLSNNTIVILLGDHGYQLGEHSMWCKHALFKTSMQVPLLIQVPGITSGEISESMVEMVDIYPTLCDLLKVDLPEHKLFGKSLKSILIDPNAEVKKAVYGRYRGGDVMMTKRYLFAFWQKGDNMIFDHSIDPNETNNLSKNPEYRSLIDKFKSSILAHLEMVK
jgi:arylsulfatase A-like enzyme